MCLTESTGHSVSTSKVALVYTAVSFLVNGVYLLLPVALMAAVSICRTTPTCTRLLHTVGLMCMTDTYLPAVH